MKKNLAKILVLVLLISLFVPSWASAATYNVTLSLTKGGVEAKAVATMQSDAATLEQLYGAFIDLRNAAKEKFGGSGYAIEFDELVDAFTTGSDAEWAAKVDGLASLTEGTADVLKDRASTIADLIAAAQGTSVTAELHDCVLVITFTDTSTSAPVTPVTPENPPASAGTEEQPSAEIQNGTATVTEEAVKEAAEKNEPILIEGYKEAASDAESAAKVNIDIPEDAGNVKVVIPVENVSDTAVIVLVKPDGTEEILPKTALTDEGLLIELDSDVTLKIIENPVEFEDIAGLTDAQKSAVAFVAARELFNGILPNVFAPDETMNRYMFATVLYRLESKPETSATVNFEDVASGKWYSEAVAWATEKGIILGYSDTDFGGEDPVTREQIALMLWRYCGKPAPTASVSTSAHKWAAEGMSWAVENGLFASDVDAQGNATRLDVAVVLKAFVNLIQGAEMNLA